MTVTHLLDMASGSDVSENHNPWRPFEGTAQLLLNTDLLDYLTDHRELDFEPGSQAERRSVDTQLSSMIPRAIGGSVAQIASEELWTPLGAEADATWSLDRDARTVIVKLSDHGTEQDEIETVDALRSIAEALGNH